MMMKNILILVFNDLAIAFKNKTFFLILFIPLFVFVSLNLVDRVNSDSSKVKIGLIQQYTYAPEITRSISAAEKLVEVTWVQDEKEGVLLLKEHKIDGILTRNEKAPGSLALLVLKKDSFHTIAIVQNISALQKAAEGNGPDWITDIKSAPRWCSKRDFAYLDTDAGSAHWFHYSPSASSRGKRKKIAPCATSDSHT